jgi:hypothetical protein
LSIRPGVLFRPLYSSFGGIRDIPALKRPRPPVI